MFRINEKRKFNQDERRYNEEILNDRIEDNQFLYNALESLTQRLNNLDDENKKDKKEIEEILHQIEIIKKRLSDIEKEFKPGDIDNIKKWIKELMDLGLDPVKLGKQYDYYLDLQDVKMIFEKTTELLELEDDPYDLGMLEFNGQDFSNMILTGRKLIDTGFEFVTKSLPWYDNDILSGGLLQIDIRQSHGQNNEDNVLYLNLTDKYQITIDEDVKRRTYKYRIEELANTNEDNVIYYEGESKMDSVLNTRNDYQLLNQNVHVLRFKWNVKDMMYEVYGLEIIINIMENEFTTTTKFNKLFDASRNVLENILGNLPIGISMNTTFNGESDLDDETFNQIIRGYSIMRLGDLINVIYDTTENDLEENKIFGLYGITSIVSVSKLADSVAGTVHQVTSEYGNLTNWEGVLNTKMEELDDYDFDGYYNVLPYGEKYPVPQYDKQTTMYEEAGVTETLTEQCKGFIDPVNVKTRQGEYPWFIINKNEINNIRFGNRLGGKLNTEYSIAQNRLNVEKGYMTKVQSDDIELETEYYMERIVTETKLNKRHGPVSVVLHHKHFNTYTVIDVDKSKAGSLISCSTYQGSLDSVNLFGYAFVANNFSSWSSLYNSETDIYMVFGVVDEVTVTGSDNIVVDLGNGTNFAAEGTLSCNIKYIDTINNKEMTTGVGINRKTINYGSDQKIVYTGAVTQFQGDGLVLSGRIFKIGTNWKSEEGTSWKKPMVVDSGWRIDTGPEGNDNWLVGAKPYYMVGIVETQGGDAIKWKEGYEPTNHYEIMRIGVNNIPDGTDEEKWRYTDMLPENRAGKKPLIYNSIGAVKYEQFLYDQLGTDVVRKNYLWLNSRNGKYEWRQCNDDGHGFFRWGSRYRSSRINPYQNTSADTLIIPLLFDDRLESERFYLDGVSPDQPLKLKAGIISNVKRDAGSYRGPLNLVADTPLNESMDGYSYGFDYVKGSDIVDGTKPLSLMTISNDLTILGKGYKVTQLVIKADSELVLPNKTISQIELSEDTVRQWNAIDQLRQYTSFLNVLIINNTKRIEYVEGAIKIINEKLDNLITTVNNDRMGNSVAKVITNFLGQTIGLFFPLIGLAFQIGSLVIDTVQHLENEDLLYGTLDIVLISLLTILGLKKFQQRLDLKYGGVNLERQLALEKMNIKNSILKLGQSTKIVFSKIGSSITKLRFSSPGYNPFGSRGKYTINSRQRDKYFSFWTKTSNIKYTKLVDETEMDVTTVLHSPTTNRSGKIVNWLKARDADWKNILDKKIKNGKVNAPVFRSNLKYHVVAKDGDAVVTKINNEAYFVYKINGKIKKYPIENVLGTKISDFTLIKDKNMTMNDWIELMHLYSGLSKTSSVVSIDDELMDSIICSARRNVRSPGKSSMNNNKVNMYHQNKNVTTNLIDENIEVIENVPSVNYNDIIKTLSAEYQSRVCITNVISALIVPDAGDTALT